MTALTLELLRKLQSASPAEAWAELFSFAWETCSPGLPDDKVAGEVIRRDRAIAPADLFLATAGWDLWSNYYDCVTRTAEQLTTWWDKNSPGRAVLILDALSLREAPWLLQGAAKRGYIVHSSSPTGAELPADTNPFRQISGIRPTFGYREQWSRKLS